MVPSKKAGEGVGQERGRRKERLSRKERTKERDIAGGHRNKAVLNRKAGPLTSRMSAPESDLDGLPALESCLPRPAGSHLTHPRGPLSMKKSPCLQLKELDGSPNLVSQKGGERWQKDSDGTK